MSYLALSREAAQELARFGSTSPYSQLLVAESFEQQSRREDAVKLYQKLSSIPPPFPGYRAAVGLGLARLGEIVPAEQLFQNELKDNPGCLSARMGIARVAIENGDPAAAMRALVESWSVDTDFVVAHAASALAGLAPDKVATFKAWLQSRIDNMKAGTANSLADLLMAALNGKALGRGGDGAFRATVDLERSGRSAANPGRLFSEGRYAQCTQNLRPKIEQLGSADLLMLARCAFYSGDYRTSFLASGRAVEFDPENLESSYWRIRTAEKLASVSLLRTSLSNPHSAKVHILLGDAFREGGHLKEAQEEYSKAIQVNPRDVAAHFGLASAYYQNFNTEQAADELKQALDLKPGDPDASFLMGSVLMLRRQYEAAKPYLLTALSGNPNNVPHAYALLGKIDATQGHLTKARAEFEKSLEADHDGSYHYQLSRVYMQLGYKQAAGAALAESEAIRKASTQRAAGRLGVPQPPLHDQ